ncbi:DUF262 domain-containing protein [Glycomyces algeriensis]|uniref:GmrSD restriction endonucleases N-terminal domain-containing protein n=1 Tax=Glycomyces algeriensis TaxID=256037 RepID=A0A9W6LE01_9ACTN|nr:DUF262 domain-containing protein [Glycomyces algeriensis]MDA1368023.1 DUF262 domain-containing protein [Glycomyces algeriensis]MDR7352531.1 hypothetical protein [Glycomyces algeriensis]GLI40213.1 hypothetical protein GALLR39Z86_00630 [Glycomyces algeriensis]
MSDVNRTIDGTAKTIGEVLANQKYAIDYYQREFRWEAKQLAELVTDLTTKFLEIYETDHDRKEVGRYPGYFLGSIIVSRKDGQPFIVDGQQRLTSLVLLLTYLHRLQSGRLDAVPVEQLICSVKFGEKSFNLDVPERNDCMNALLEHGRYMPLEGSSESVRILAARYDELEGLFPGDLKDEALPFFVDWLVDRVQLVQITAYTDDDAYAIFETMNDRGLKLTPADMLKGYLLANMDEGEPRIQANELWRKRLRALADRTDDAAADFLKTWLRSQYSTKIRERKKGARPENWDRIGTEFHRWLRGAHEHVGLRTRGDYHRFVVKDLDFYSRQYERILNAASGDQFDPTSPLRFIRYNADLGFTLQDQLLLAPLRVEDDEATVDRKLEIVGRFVGILLARRIWNSRSTVYSTMQYAMFNVMRDIRGLDPKPLAEALHDYFKDQDSFDSTNDLLVHQQNRKALHRILARITDYVTVESGGASNYAELVGDEGVHYEVEHIWANRPERHTGEFRHAADFARHRNRIGDFLLLPKKFNASFGDDTYEEKLPHYYGQNLLAASLNSLSYEKNPGFVSFIKNSNLPFRAHASFKATDVVKRGALYREIAKRIWNPDDLLSAASAP